MTQFVDIKRGTFAPALGSRNGEKQQCPGGRSNPLIPAKNDTQRQPHPNAIPGAGPIKMSRVWRRAVFHVSSTQMGECQPGSLDRPTGFGGSQIPHILRNVDGRFGEISAREAQWARVEASRRRTPAWPRGRRHRRRSHLSPCVLHWYLFLEEKTPSRSPDQCRFASTRLGLLHRLQTAWLFVN